MYMFWEPDYDCYWVVACWAGIDSHHHTIFLKYWRLGLDEHNCKQVTDSLTSSSIFISGWKIGLIRVRIYTFPSITNDSKIGECMRGSSWWSTWVCKLQSWGGNTCMNLSRGQRKNKVFSSFDKFMIKHGICYNKSSNVNWYHKTHVVFVYNKKCYIVFKIKKLRL